MRQWEDLIQVDDCGFFELEWIPETEDKEAKILAKA